MRRRSYQSKLMKARWKRDRTKWFFTPHVAEMEMFIECCGWKTFMWAQKTRQEWEEICCALLNGQTITAPEDLLGQRRVRDCKEEEWQGKCHDCSCFFLDIHLWSLLEEEHWARGMLGLNQYSHPNFHKLFIVWGSLGRLIVMKIHGSGQIPSSAWNTSNQHRIYDLRVFFSNLHGRRETWVWRNWVNEEWIFQRSCWNNGYALCCLQHCFSNVFKKISVSE